MAGTILEHEAVVIAEHRVADGQLHANAGRASRHDKRPHTQGPQPRVQVGFEEPTIAVFPHHGIAWKWDKLRQNFGVPGIVYQDAARPSVG